MARTAQTARASNATPQEAPEITEEQEKLAKGPMQATLQHLDYKLSDKSVWYYIETIEDNDIPEQVNWWDMYALCLIRQFSGEHVSNVSLRVNSPHLKEILKSEIGTFPGISFETKNVTVGQPYRVLYHYRPELLARRTTLEDDSDAAKHLDLLLNFVGETFKDTIADADNLREKGLMSYSLLWTIFRPGSIVFSTKGGNPRMYKLNSYHYECDPPAFVLNVSYTDFDGEEFGVRNDQLKIPAFAGAAPINALRATPAEYTSNRERIEEVLLARGRRFEGLAGVHFRHYTGIATNDKGRFNHDGRVVVDTKTFHQENANRDFTVVPYDDAAKHKYEEDSDDYDDYDCMDYDEPRRRLKADDELDGLTNGARQGLTDEQAKMATHVVRGFSFAEKDWYDFDINGLSDIKWNTDCFEKLVLPAVQKETVKALVSTHVHNALGFDDIVQGKGRGLVLVLHGPPGVGKTLTAETVAEFCKRPLYMVSSGDLGTNSSTLDERLSRILKLAATWKAVLLIDEADIFLERRSLHDMERNSMVSIFLRVLEYYQGILFCTTNRVKCFDDAFKSRIHVPLKYDDLTVDARKRIWKNLLAGIPNLALSEKDYDKLSDVYLNGRQIKNVIRTAKSLAEYHGNSLNVKQLQQVVDIQNEFEKDLSL